MFKISRFFLILAVFVGLIIVGWVFASSKILQEQFDNIINNPEEKSNPEPEENIIVFSPSFGDEIAYPLKVIGKARVFEGVVSLRLKDDNNQILFEGFTMANSPDMGLFGVFEKDIYYNAATMEKGVLEVFESSAKDGSEINKAIVAVKFKTLETTSVKIFFGNSVKDPNVLDCKTNFSAERIIPKSMAVARAVIEELLKGPTEYEKSQGYFTSINSGVEIQSLNIVDSIAKIDFNEQLEYAVGGSCRVAAIRSQIIETLKQFPTVKDVIISINGRIEDILQP